MKLTAVMSTRLLEKCSKVQDAIRELFGKIAGTNERMDTDAFEIAMKKLGVKNECLFEKIDCKNRGWINLIDWEVYFDSFH